ncbi:MAG: SPOR domain-containing protein, partial [Parasphingorhabdus sp.]
AQMARPGAYETRVAAVLNVTPVANDPGQPVRLALRPTQVPVSVAASSDQDYESEVASFDRNSPLPAIGPAPKAEDYVDFLAQENNVKVANVAIPASEAVAKAPVKIPLVKADAKPVRVAATKFIEESDKPVVAKKAAFQTVPAVKPVLQKAAFQPAAKPATVPSGTHLVQLGAFSSAEGAKRAWGILSAENSDLNSFNYATSPINVNGKTLYRLAAIGFGNAQSADAMCDGIKAKGGNCIVRNAPGVNKASPSRMASKAPKKLASR